MKRLVLTVLAPDRPGIVREMAEVVADAGGSWLESRMATLAGRFAGILLVEAPAPSAAPLATALRALPGLKVTVDEVETLDEAAAPEVEITVVGTDRPGIVRRIASVLAAAGVNVESLETERRDAPVAGGRLFEARALVRLPAGVRADALQSEIEAIASDLIVEWEGPDGAWSIGR